MQRRRHYCICLWSNSAVVEFWEVAIWGTGHYTADALPLMRSAVRCQLWTVKLHCDHLTDTNGRSAWPVWCGTVGSRVRYVSMAVGSLAAITTYGKMMSSLATVPASTVRLSWRGQASFVQIAKQKVFCWAGREYGGDLRWPTFVVSGCLRWKVCFAHGLTIVVWRALSGFTLCLLYRYGYARHRGYSLVAC